MHMADALISPAVGGAMMAVSAGAAIYSIRKIQKDPDDMKIPLMGVMGAFVFAAQMINFTIPGTGSSGHIGGGMLLSALLGPYAGFLTMASILLIQALFFADGGLLAYGCNLFNLGFMTCFIAYPLIYKYITRKGISAGRILKASMLSAIVGLQLGAFSVVIETLLSGKTELPFTEFLLLMQPIHLAISIVEGLVTAAVVTFVWKARPEIVGPQNLTETRDSFPMRRLIAILAAVTLVIGGVLSWFASSNPDGLEWSVNRITGSSELKSEDQTHQNAARVQKKTSIFPKYSLKSSNDGNKPGSTSENKNVADNTAAGKASTAGEAGVTSADAGKSAAGITGAVMTLALAGMTALIISLAKKKKRLQSQVE